MNKCFAFLIGIFIYNNTCAQEVLDKTLLKADKHYIQKQYGFAVLQYVKYLKKYPRDYYASRQAARCYDRLNDPYNAVDHWPAVIESSEVTEADYLDYARCLLANNRTPEAKKIFLYLSKSKDPDFSAWGKTYLQPSFDFVDTASVKIQELINVNTNLSESCPVFLDDKLFFVSNKKPGALNFTALDNESTQSLKVYLITDSVQFLPTLLFEKLQQLNIRYQVCFSKDGKWMYFTKAVSNTEMNLKSKVPYFKHQIFLLNLSTLNTPFPEIINFEHNLPGYNTMHPALSNDGQYLYFSSDRKGALGGMDIYVCIKNNSGWSAPINLGPNINTIGNEVFPFFTTDGMLYFSSDQRPGLGGLDIFSAKLSGEQASQFEMAKNCGGPINSRFDDFGVFILEGGSKGYLSSKRKSNTDEDLYYFNRK